MKREAFGERAQHVLPLVPDFGRPLIVATPRTAHLAIPAALEIRQHSGPFDLLLLVPETSAIASAAAASALVQQHRAHDIRRALMQNLPRAQHGVQSILPPEHAAMRDLAALSERWLVRSWREYNRVSRLLALAPREVERFMPARAIKPASAPGDTIVIWAPEYESSYVSAILTTLQEFERPVSLVSKGTAPPDDLEHAALIIDASIDDPSHAYAFAQAGYRVAAAQTSGINEYAPDVAQYEPGFPTSIVRAMNAALTSKPATTLEVHLPRIVPASVSPAGGPRVSVVVRTVGRQQLLRRALMSLRAQTYQNIEIVLVNDGKVDLSAIAARFGARYTQTPGGNNARAANAGLALATGTYVSLLDDDDAALPDHVEKLVEALIRSGAAAAHSDALTLHIARTGDTSEIIGVNAFLVRAVQVSRMLVSNQLIGSSRAMFKRELLEALGPFNEWLRLSNDYEFCLRIAQQFDFVHVDAVTSLYSWFLDGSNSSQAKVNPYVNDFRVFYADHPVGNRAYLRKARDAFESHLRRTNALKVTPPSYKIPLTPLFD